MISIACAECGKVYTTNKYSAEHGSRFCSRKCKDSSHGDFFRAERHQNWKGGKTESYLRAKKTGYHREYARKLRRKLLEEVGGTKCAICGFSDWRVLQIDHVNGDGAKERRSENANKLKYTNNFLKHILANRGNYQVLCSNCNWIKVYENNENKRHKPYQYKTRKVRNHISE